MLAFGEQLPKRKKVIANFESNLELNCHLQADYWLYNLDINRKPSLHQAYRNRCYNYAGWSKTGIKIIVVDQKHKHKVIFTKR